MQETKLYTAREQVVEAMEQGLPCHEATKRAGLEISQATAYRLRPIPGSTVVSFFADFSPTHDR